MIKKVFLLLLYHHLLHQLIIGMNIEGVVVACTMLGSAPLVHIVAIGYGIRYGVLLVDWTQHTKIPSQFLAIGTMAG